MKKFNALDIFICVMIFAVVAVIVFYLGGSAGSPVMASGKKTVYFTVEIQHTPVNFSDKIKIGDTIEDSTKGFYYGVVSDIYVEPTKTDTLNAAEKKMVRALVPEHETIYLTVKCNGTESDTEIAAEGHVVKVGKKMTLKGKGYASAGFITGLRTEQE